MPSTTPAVFRSYVLALALALGSLLVVRPAAADSAPLPGYLSDRVVHYDVSKIPTTPGRCIVFASDNGGKFDSYGACDGRSLESFLGEGVVGQGGLAVVLGADGREWRFFRRYHGSAKLDVVLAGLFRSAGLEPAEPLVFQDAAGVPHPTTRTKASSFTSKGPPQSRVAAGVAFTVVGYDYGIVVTGSDAAVVESDLALALSAIAVDDSPRVARYSPVVVRVFELALGLVALVAVVTFALSLSARAKKQREAAKMEAMAARWTDRARPD